MKQNTPNRSRLKWPRIGALMVPLFTWAVALVAIDRASAAEPPSHPSDSEFFETKIRPVLVERCYKCHSAAAKSIKGGLRLDTRAGLLKGGDGGPALVPGEPQKSRIIEAIVYQNPDLQMPPKSALPAQQVADLAAWVRQGAPWPAEPAVATTQPTAGAAQAFDLWQRRSAHWAWQPVQPHTPPAVKDAAWPRGAVDRFVLSRLEQQGLQPAPPADRRVLIRRTYFVVTGLPPTPEEVEAFVQDAAPNALEKIVDRLLASPEFGERWARHWMDLVRYSDTLGSETDLPIHNAWQYRDYLIRAFNTDLPYDQLVMEHIAGDLLPHPRRQPRTNLNESVIGTGFFCLNEGKRSPVDLRQAEADGFDNGLDVLCKTFLGLTVSCARCHDHKFDAIPTSDYYALFGYLKSSRYTQAMLNSAEVNERTANLAALRSQIREAGGAALAGRAGNLARYLVAASSPSSPPASQPAAAAPAAAVTTDRTLDPVILQRWRAALKEPIDVNHPLFTWKRMTDPSAAASAAALAAAWKDAETRVRSRSAEAGAKVRQRDGDEPLADFKKSGYQGWFVEDQSFGPAPLRPADFLMGPDANRPILTFVRGGAWAHSGFLARRLQGTLRSPSFTIDRRFLHVLAAGRAARMNVVIDHFVMIQDPLYGGLRRVLNDDGPHWHTFDLSMWKGQQAYLELADTTTPDLHEMGSPAGCGPEGYIAAGQVLLSDQGPPPSFDPVAGAALFDARIGSADGAALVHPESIEAAARRYQQVVTESLAAFAKGQLADSPAAEEQAALLAWLVERGLLDPTASPADEAAKKILESLFKQFRAAEAAIPDPQRAPAIADATPQDGSVYIRGNPKTPGAVAPRRMLQAIAGPAIDQAAAPAGSSGRLELARSFASPSNPLIARVMVNRIWHHVFGKGIVPSVDNFGVLGDKPSNPELLDYLADRFVKEGWSTKKLIRELVLSNTFAMTSHGSDAAELADPDNRLLHRIPLRRLEAEAIRDEILAVSGSLDVSKRFGPAVEVYLTPFMANGYADNYGKPQVSGPLDGDGRRSIYQIVRRNFLPPLMTAFDAPAPLNTAGRRSVSNVPAQALILMNEPFVAGQAALWAKHILSRPGLDEAGRVHRMYQQAFCRDPSDAELDVAHRFLERQGDELRIPPEKRASDERIWADFAHVLMNVKEFIYVP